MSQYKLAIFDLAGTTVSDTNSVGGCLQQALRLAGVEASVEDVNSVMGQSKPLAIQTLLQRHGVEGDVSVLYAEFRRLMLEFYQVSDTVTEIPGTSELFTKLKEQGIRIAVNTGFEREITDAVIARMGWNDLIDDSISTDEVVNGRPAPDMIRALSIRAGVEPAEVIKVGDTPADIGEGKSAEVGLIVGVSYGTHAAEVLRAEGAHVIIDDIRDLADHLDE